MTSTPKVQNSALKAQENKAIAAVVEEVEVDTEQAAADETPNALPATPPKGHKRVTLAGFWGEHQPGDQVDVDIDTAASLDRGGYVVREQ